MMWGNVVNRGGLYSKKPMKLKKDTEFLDEDNPKWWTPDQNMHFEKEGLDVRDGCIRFMSSSKEEVEAWTKGVLSAQKIIGDVFGNVKLK